MTTIKQQFDGGAISSSACKKYTREELEEMKAIARANYKPVEWNYTPLQAMREVAREITGNGEYRDADYNYYFSPRGGRRYIDSLAMIRFKMKLNERQVDVVYAVCNKLSVTSSSRDILRMIEEMTE